MSFDLPLLIRRRRSGGGGLPTDGRPTLIIDFVPIADPDYGDSLSLNFTTGQYKANTVDPVSPDGIINIQVWS